MSTYLYRLARWCFRHRRRVLGGWLLAVIVVVVLSVLGHGTENNSITIPGTESQEVVHLLQAKIPAFSGAQTQVVFASPGSQDVTSSAYATDIKQAVASPYLSRLSFFSARVVRSSASVGARPGSGAPSGRSPASTSDR